MLTNHQIIKWLYSAASIIEENSDLLNRLDATIGDAEHGINMERGFKLVVKNLPSITDSDIGSILKKTGMVLLSSVGGASGALYGTFFIQAGTTASGKYELDTSDIIKLFDAGLAGVIERGKTQVGDKTMVDSLAPAVAAFSQAATENLSMEQAIQQAVNAAEKGMRDTIPMVAKKGRASYLAERSVGHQDPGATSLFLILKALHDTISEKP